MPRFLPTAFVAPQVRKTVWTASALVAVSLLGGCSIWPKALTFGGGQDDAAMAQASEPTLPMPGAPAMTTTAATAAAPAAAASAVAVAPAAEAPKVEPAAPAPVAPSNVPQPSPLPPSAPEVAPATPVAPAVSGKAASAPLVSGYYINVGLFAVASNANNAFQKLEKAGMPVFSDGVQSAKGPVTRVRVGPFASRAQATTAAAKIRSLKLEAVVFKQ